MGTVARQPPLPWTDYDRRVRRPRLPRPERVAPEGIFDLVQLPMWPPSVMRRVTVRRRRVFAFASLDGSRGLRFVTESIPCAIPTSADDLGLPDFQRWTPPRHTREFDRLPYAEDMSVRMFVRDHPEGASLQEIADEIGMTKQGVNEILDRAVRKIVEAARGNADVVEWIADVLGWDVEDVEVRLCRLS